MMRRSLFNWRKVESEIKSGHIDRAFELISQALIQRLQQKQPEFFQDKAFEQELSPNLKIYFKQGLTGDHTQLLKLKFMRTLAFHPSLGDHNVGQTINALFT